MVIRKTHQVQDQDPPLGMVVQNADAFTVDDIVIQPGDVPMKQVSNSNGIIVAILSEEDFDSQFITGP